MVFIMSENDDWDLSANREKIPYKIELTIWVCVLSMLTLTPIKN